MSRIMVVDDEPDVVELIKTILEGEGYDVIRAESGNECLEKLEKETSATGERLDGRFAIRMGLRYVKGLGENDCRKIEDARKPLPSTMGEFVIAAAEKEG